MAHWLSQAWKATLGRLGGVSRPRIGTGGSALGRWFPGRGVPFVPPQSERDHIRIAGDVRMCSVVAVAGNWLARQFLQASLEVGKKDEKGQWEADRTGPAQAAADVLKRWNPIWGARQSWGGVVPDYAVDGNAYLKKARNVAGEVVELYWLPNCFVTVVAARDPDAVHPIDHYRYWDGTRWEEYPPEDVVHLRDLPDPLNPLVGLGRVKQQIRNVVGLNAAERYTAAILINSHAGKMVIPKMTVEEAKFSGGADPAELEAVVRAIKEGIGGENAGTVRSANLPVELLDLGLGPEQMRLDVITDRPEAMVCSAMGLNPMALDLPSSRDSRTYSNKGEARREAWEQGVIPLQDAIADDLTMQLLPDFMGPESGLEFGWDRRDVPALREDEDGRMGRATTAFSNTLVTRNRALQLAGLDPLPEADVAGERYYGDPTSDDDEAEADDDGTDGLDDGSGPGAGADDTADDDPDDANEDEGEAEGEEAEGPADD
jgi:phage portal protein BeeE